MNRLRDASEWSDSIMDPLQIHAHTFKVRPSPWLGVFPAAMFSCADGVLQGHMLKKRSQGAPGWLSR